MEKVLALIIQWLILFVKVTRCLSDWLYKGFIDFENADDVDEVFLI